MRDEFGSRRVDVGIAKPGGNLEGGGNLAGARVGQ